MINIHKTADVDKTATIGKGTMIWNQAQIRENAKIGTNCIIGKNVYIDTEVIIGNNVKIQNNVSIYKGVTIENDVFIAPHVCFTNDKYPKAVNCNGTPKKEKDWHILKTLIRKGASIGANSTVICGNIIGENAMIGAGSVVTKSIPDNNIAYGNPAKIQNQEIFDKHTELIKCNNCKLWTSLTDKRGFCPTCSNTTRLSDKDYLTDI